jgi:hypothetical protein
MVNSKFRKKYTRKNKKSNKSNKKRFLHKRGGRQPCNTTNYIDNQDDNDNSIIYDVDDGTEIVDDNNKIKDIIVFIHEYILQDNPEYNTNLLNHEINQLDIDNLYNKIQVIIDITNAEDNKRKHRKEEVIVALNNILDLVPRE